MPVTKTQSYTFRRSFQLPDKSWTTIEVSETQELLAGEDPIKAFQDLHDLNITRFLTDFKAVTGQK